MSRTFVTWASYDWRLLPESIAAYYEQADEILVGVDRDGLTWSGLPNGMDWKHFQEVMEAIDPAGKITLVVEPFFTAGKTPRENNDAGYRRLYQLAHGEWIVAVDADEVVTDVPALLKGMNGAPMGRQVYGRWTNVFKVIGDTALVVTPETHLCALATRSREPVRAKLTEELPFYVPVVVQHNTLGRSEAEVALKLASYGHRDDVRPGFFEFWKAVDLTNYQTVRDCHPFIPSQWPGLTAIPLKDLR
jgi:hypothetical protein